MRKISARGNLSEKQDQQRKSRHLRSNRDRQDYSDKWLQRVAEKPFKKVSEPQRLALPHRVQCHSFHTRTLMQLSVLPFPLSGPECYFRPRSLHPLLISMTGEDRTLGRSANVFIRFVVRILYPESLRPYLLHHSPYQLIIPPPPAESSISNPESSHGDRHVLIGRFLGCIRDVRCFELQRIDSGYVHIRCRACDHPC